MLINTKSDRTFYKFTNNYYAKFQKISKIVFIQNFTNNPYEDLTLLSNQLMYKDYWCVNSLSNTPLMQQKSFISTIQMEKN